MSYAHATDDPIVEAEALTPGAEEEDDIREPRLLQLFLDSDGRYRWYEEEEASEVSSHNLLEAVEGAESAWDGFQIVEVRGAPVQPDSKLEDSYGPEELESLEEL
jgi:hypothetical protein